MITVTPKISLLHSRRIQPQHELPHVYKPQQRIFFWNKTLMALKITQDLSG